MTSLMVSQVTRLQFHIEIYTGKDKHKGRYPFKKRSSKHQGRQQRHSTIEGQIVAMEDNSKSRNNKRKQDKVRKLDSQVD